jgi:hypothetical protein
MFWKIFAIITLLATIVSVFTGLTTPQGFLGDLEIVMGVISCSFIYSYAFKYPTKARNVAKAFAWIFSIYAIWVVTSSLVGLQDAFLDGNTPLSATVFAAAFVIGQTLLEWLAIWRYGQDPTFEKSQQRGAEAA